MVDIRLVCAIFDWYRDMPCSRVSMSGNRFRFYESENGILTQIKNILSLFCVLFPYSARVENADGVFLKPTDRADKILSANYPSGKDETKLSYKQ